LKTEELAMPKQTPNSPKNSPKVGIKKKSQDDARNKTGHVGLKDKANAHLIHVLSGGLGQELQAHAYERCRHFFLFVCTIRALEYINNEVLKRKPVRAVSGFRTKATDQVDDGFRSESDDRLVFGRDDPNVVDLPATAFQNTDAAHFCNLGIDPAFVNGLDLTDRVTNDLYQELKVFAGNTRWLPQLVNIGPDRRIDILHGKLAERYLKDASNAVCSRSRINNYVSEAHLSLQVYAQTKTKQNKRGVAACTQCYLKAYGTKDFADSVFKVVSGNVVGWCSATKNTAALSRLVAYG
jgi:hypothetical protein